MRLSFPLALFCLVAGGLSLQAQERISLLPPDPLPGGQTGQVPLPPPVQPGQPPVSPGQAPPMPPYPPPVPYNPYAPYPPPPAIYGPPPPGAFGPPPPGMGYRHALTGDPANDPAFWVGAEALVWWMKGEPLPIPLITTGPSSQGANAGGLGMPGTVSLNQPLNFNAEGGVRLFAGGWFDQGHVFGMDGSLFVLGNPGASFGANDRSGNGTFVINEPVSGLTSTQVSAPGVGTGNAFVNVNSQFWGLETNLMLNVLRGGGWTVNLIGGFRYLQLDEWMSITGNSTIFNDTTFMDGFGNPLVTAPAGSGVTTIDQFNTHNQFYGGQIGARFRYNMGRWSIDGSGSLAIGATHESVDINGTTIVYPVNGTPVPLTGGNYATLQIGRYSQDRFAVAPEARLNLGYQFTPWLRGTIGYDFLFLSSVLRPGNQIDNVYDGVSHPMVPMKTSTYWSQGLNVGLQFNW